MAQLAVESRFDHPIVAVQPQVDADVISAQRVIVLERDIVRIEAALELRIAVAVDD
jgi:hypothetical protein